MTNNKYKSVFLTVMLIMSVFAGAAAFAGSAAANHDEADADATLDDGEAYWAGQNILVDATTAEEQTLEIREGDSEDSTFVREVSTDAEGHFVLDTADLEGDYIVIDADDNAEHFEIRQQSFSVDFDSNQVNNHDDSTVEMTADSNRATYDVMVGANGLEAADLYDEVEEDGIFANYEGNIIVDDEADTITLEDFSDYDTSLDLQFEGVAEGDYSFAFDVADSSASDTQDITVGEAGDANAQFSDTIYTGTVGETVTFDIELDNTDSATVVIGDEDEIGYENEFQVTDNNEDGVVTVEYNTYEAGQDGINPLSVAGDSEGDSDTDADTITPVHETTVSEGLHLSAYAYDMSLELSDSEVDVATLNLNDRSTDSMSTNVAPTGADLSDMDGIDENVVEQTDIAMEDQFILKVEADGLNGWFSDDVQTAADLAEDSQFAEDYGMYLEITEDNPSILADAETLDLAEGTLVTDDGAFYVVFDTNNDNVAVEDGDEYTAEFTLDESNPYVADEDSVETLDSAITFVDRDVQLDGVDVTDSDDTLHLDKNNESVVTISGDTTVAPGTEFDFRTRSTGESPFLKSSSTTVESDQTFAADFDFSDVEDGAEFTTEVRHYTDRVNSQVGEAPPETHSLDVSVENADGEAVDDATVSVGDESADAPAAFDLEAGTYTVNAEAEGYLAGSTDVTLEGDDSVVITLDEEPDTYGIDVMVENEDGDALDADVTVDGEPLGDSYEDGTYTVSANADGYEAASEDVTVDGADASVTLTLSEEEPAEPVDDSEPVDDDSDEDTPGFGIAVALVALFGAALVAYRNQ